MSFNMVLLVDLVNLISSVDWPAVQRNILSMSQKETLQTGQNTETIQTVSGSNKDKRRYDCSEAQDLDRATEKIDAESRSEEGAVGGEIDWENDVRSGSPSHIQNDTVEDMPETDNALGDETITEDTNNQYSSHHTELETVKDKIVKAKNPSNMLKDWVGSTSQPPLSGQLRAVRTRASTASSKSDNKGSKKNTGTTKNDK